MNLDLATEYEINAVEKACERIYFGLMNFTVESKHQPFGICLSIHRRREILLVLRSLTFLKRYNFIQLEQNSSCVPTPRPPMIT